MRKNCKFTWKNSQIYEKKIYIEKKYDEKAQIFKYNKKIKQIYIKIS